MSDRIRPAAPPPVPDPEAANAELVARCQSIVDRLLADLNQETGPRGALLTINVLANALAVVLHQTDPRSRERLLQSVGAGAASILQHIEGGPSPGPLH